MRVRISGSASPPPSRSRAASAIGSAKAPATAAALHLLLQHAVLEALRLGQGLELLQRVVLDLPDPLAGDAERAADLLERARLRPVEPVAELDHAPLPRRQRRE